MENLPIMITTPAGAIVVGRVLIRADVAIGLSSDGASGTGTGTIAP
jgi:hypothetical protein